MLGCAGLTFLEDIRPTDKCEYLFRVFHSEKVKKNHILLVEVVEDKCLTILMFNGKARLN